MDCHKAAIVSYQTIKVLHFFCAEQACLPSNVLSCYTFDAGFAMCLCVQWDLFAHELFCALLCVQLGSGPLITVAAVKLAVSPKSLQTQAPKPTAASFNVIKFNVSGQRPLGRSIIAAFEQHEQPSMLASVSAYQALLESEFVCVSCTQLFVICKLRPPIKREIAPFTDTFWSTAAKAWCVCRSTSRI